MKYIKKEIIKESKKCYLIVDIVFYIIICLIGSEVLFLNELKYVSTLKYLYLIFYIIAFFSVVAYFVNRRKHDYEFLYFALINIYAGSFVLIYSNYLSPNFIVGCSLLIYTIMNGFNKGIHAYRLDYNNKIESVSKLSIMLALMLLSIFTSIYFYKYLIIDNEVLGYYFLTFGLISLLEPFLCIVLNNKSISKKMLRNDIKRIEVKKITKKEIKKIKK